MSELDITNPLSDQQQINTKFELRFAQLEAKLDVQFEQLQALIIGKLVADPTAESEGSVNSLSSIKGQQEETMFYSVKNPMVPIKTEPMDDSNPQKPKYENTTEHTPPRIGVALQDIQRFKRELSTIYDLQELCTHRELWKDWCNNHEIGAQSFANTLSKGCVIEMDLENDDMKYITESAIEQRLSEKISTAGYAKQDLLNCLNQLEIQWTQKNQGTSMQLQMILRAVQLYLHRFGKQYRYLMEKTKVDISAVKRVAHLEQARKENGETDVYTTCTQIIVRRINELGAGFVEYVMKDVQLEKYTDFLHLLQALQDRVRECAGQVPTNKAMMTTMLHVQKSLQFQKAKVREDRDRPLLIQARAEQIRYRRDNEKRLAGQGQWGNNHRDNKPLTMPNKPRVSRMAAEDAEYFEYETDEEEERNRKIELEAMRIVEMDPREPIRDDPKDPQSVNNLAAFQANMQGVQEAKDLMCFANALGKCTRGNDCKFSHAKEKVKQYVADINEANQF